MRITFSIGALLGLLSLASLVSAQTVQVLNATQGSPIPEVFIYNSAATQSVITDGRGKADLSIFTETDKLYLQHPSYTLLATSKEELSAQDYIAYLVEKVVQMEEVLVSGNKWEQDRREIPTQITRVSAQEIALANPQTSADMLAQTGEVFVQKSQLGGGSPMIRGFAANSVLIVVDGVRMNNAIYRSGNLQNVLNVDANFLQNAEVILGPGSVIYGSDALGGVMDFHTVDPMYAQEKSWDVGGLARYSSANNERTVSAQATYTSQRSAWVVGGSYSAFSDLRTGRNGLEEYDGYGQRPWYVSQINGEDTMLVNDDPAIQIGSGYSTYSGFAKGKMRLADGLELSITSLLSTTSDVPRYDRLVEMRDGQARSAEWYYGPQRWWFNAVKLHHFAPTRFYDEAKFTVGFQDYAESRNDRRFGSEFLRTRTEAVQVVTFNADFDKILGDKHHLFYGMEAFTNVVSSTGQEQNIVTGAVNPVAPRYPDGGSDYGTVAAYLSHKWHPWESGTLTSGIRYSFIDLNAQFGSDFYDFPYDEINLQTGALNGSMGLAQRLGEYWQLNAMLASGFRAPNIDDIGKVFDSEPGNVVVPNPDLQPEFVYSAELGLRYTTDKIDLQTNGFYAWYQNAMVRREFTLNGQDSIVYDGELSQVEALVNTGAARIYGLSASARAQLGTRWSVRGSYTWTDGYDEDGNIPLRHTTPQFGQVSVIYQQDRWRAEFYVPFQGARAWDELAPSEQDKPHLYPPGEVGSLGWYTLNLRGNYRINPHWSVQASIENILDVHYRPYSSGISAPGRNVMVAIRRRL